MAGLRTTLDIRSGGFIWGGTGYFTLQEDLAMETSNDYVIAPDGEIVKVSEGNYEHTGMYVVD